MLVIVDAYLDKQEEVRVLALGGGPLALLDVVLGNVDTLALRRPPSAFHSAIRAAFRAHHLASCRDLLIATSNTGAQAASG